MSYCPTCHQPLLHMREGVRLSVMKAHIFDVVKRAAHVGITAEDINAICFEGRSNPRNIKMHIWQINEAIADTGVRISGGTTGMVGFYHLVRRDSPLRIVN